LNRLVYKGDKQLPLESGDEVRLVKDGKEVFFMFLRPKECRRVGRHKKDWDEQESGSAKWRNDEIKQVVKAAYKFGVGRPACIKQEAKNLRPCEEIQAFLFSFLEKNAGLGNAVTQEFVSNLISLNKPPVFKRKSEHQQRLERTSHQVRNYFLCRLEQGKECVITGATKTFDVGFVRAKRILNEVKGKSLC